MKMIKWDVARSFATQAGVLALLFVLTTILSLVNHFAWSAAYIVLMVTGIWLTLNYSSLVGEKIHDFIKFRESCIAEKLQWWNQVKFREGAQVEWCVGLLGSYIELGCIEGRPLENINYCFPPKAKTSAQEVLFPGENAKEETDQKVSVELSTRTCSDRSIGLSDKLSDRTASTDDDSCSSDDNL